MSDALSWATHNQFVSASGSVSEQAGRQLQAFGGVAQTSVSYSFEIVDPKAGVQPVLMFIRASGVATASGQGSGSGYFDLVQTGPSGSAKDILDLSVCSGEGLFRRPGVVVLLRAENQSADEHRLRDHACSQRGRIQYRLGAVHRGGHGPDRPTPISRLIPPWLTPAIIRFSSAPASSTRPTM